MADEQNKDEKPATEPTPAPEADAPAPEGDAPAAVEAAAETEAEAEAEKEPEANEPGVPLSDPATERATPAAILARVQKLGEEDELDRVAREEEEKLAERRAAAKKKSKLESAASKKLDQIGTKPKKKKRPVVAEAAPEEKPYNDALYRRTMTLGEWINKNKKQVGTVVAALAVAGLGAFAYFSYTGKQNADASRILIAATDDENGRIGSAKKDDDGPPDPRPEFATVEARNASALGKYREVSSKYKGTGAAILARLAEGSILLDSKDADGALAAFGEAHKSPLAAVDAEVRGRALEGMGFAYEMKGNLDEAMKTYKDLENNVEVKGFKELAIYHQARVAEAKGDKDKAKELYKTVHTRVTDPIAKLPFPYLQEAVEDRLRALDPSALPAKQSPFGMGGGAPGQSKINEAQMKKLQEQIKKQMEEAQQKQKEAQEKGAP